MIHIVIGPPCAGKSTYVKQRMLRGDVAIDVDALEDALGNTMPHNPADAVKDAALVARRVILDRCVARGYTTWAIYTNRPDDLSPFGDKYDVRVVDPGEEECLRRAEEDGRPDGTAERIRAWYEDNNEKGGKAVKHLVKEFAVKAGENGHLRAYAATWDREPDCYGDIVAKGAFTETLKAHKDAGQKIPLLFGHVTDDPDYIIGEVTEAVEDDTGLLIDADFNDGAKAQSARARVLDGTLYKMSFAYEVLEAGAATLESGQTVNELRKLELFEVSLVPIPANPHAVVVDAKAADTNAPDGGDPAAETDDLGELRDLLGQAVNKLDELLGESGDAPDGNPDEGEDLKSRNALVKRITEAVEK